MSTANKTFWDIYWHPHNTLQKVNFRQYLSDRQEPVIVTSGIKAVDLEKQSGIIEDTYLRKRIIRKLARSLRIRN
jgi:hypothetical protein